MILNPILRENQHSMEGVEHPVKKMSPKHFAVPLTHPHEGLKGVRVTILLVWLTIFKKAVSIALRKLEGQRCIVSQRQKLFRRRIASSAIIKNLIISLWAINTTILSSRCVWSEFQIYLHVDWQHHQRRSSIAWRTNPFNKVSWRCGRSMCGVGICRNREICIRCKYLIEICLRQFVTQKIGIETVIDYVLVSRRAPRSLETRIVVLGCARAVQSEQRNDVLLEQRRDPHFERLQHRCPPSRCVRQLCFVGVAIF